MPGAQVKNWDRYHALRRKGASKEQAARIANAEERPKRRRRRRRKAGALERRARRRKGATHPMPDGSMMAGARHMGARGTSQRMT